MDSATATGRQEPVLVESTLKVTTVIGVLQTIGTMVRLKGVNLVPVTQITPWDRTVIW